MTKRNTTTLESVTIGNDHYYKIADSDHLRPFFMSIVSDSDHWMFISSNGGLSAGRKNAEYALFPYYTDDKITEFTEITGSKTIFQIQNDDNTSIWEPFSYRYEGRFNISRNLYKSAHGNKVLFEEVNHDLNMVFRYQWSSSNTFGFVRTSTLINMGAQTRTISLLDGIQNIIPYGVNSDLQNNSSNLVDAYKRSELEQQAGLGIYSLSAIIVDKAEPSEALKANIVWSLGLDAPTHLLSSLQLNRFRKGLSLQEEIDIKAEKGAYFLNTTLALDAKEQKEWMIVANVNQNHSAIAKIEQTIRTEKQLKQLVQQDVEAGTERLILLNAAADGLQLTADELRDTRHFSNVLFNIMRGGIFDNNYQIEKWDFKDYLAKASKAVYAKTKATIAQLPDEFSLTTLKEVLTQSDDLDFKRLCLEYMPLKFSRRHGDPSRPWNKFSINTRSEKDGSKILDYQGNWRDIFQNWEALVHSYPEFIESMISKFLNATTFDGYNPYRVTKDGFDWEISEPDDPWSYIGYWGDHQIIYLLKFLEFIEKHEPGKLDSYFGQALFVYANVPYTIKSYEDILRNPKDTIEFNVELDHKIREQRETEGADGALLRDADKSIYRVNFIEKILATLLAKMSNYIPEGGIWMNTQRPEWNDANNALVGNGVSMVTLYYIRRFLHFFKQLLATSKTKQVEISSELLVFFNAVTDTLSKQEGLLSGQMNDADRKRVLDGLGKAGSTYREQGYQQNSWGKKATLSFDALKQFIELSLKYTDHTIDANKREDNLYHAYNLMTVESEKEVSISYLSEMLEGQVAVLSSGYLSSPQALEALDGLKQSSLFRKDQYSYILYPNKDLPRFIKKNNIADEAISQSKLLTQLVNDNNLDILEKDVNEKYHFNGNFKNANDLQVALNELATTNYAALVEKDQKQVLQAFEDIFNHKAFTGRSGTFFGYEGLGSIYWHMVSKLLLAVQENCLKAIREGATEEVIGRLLAHYYEINEGIGVHKPPSLYGAFSVDPYSHTPAGKGAQQPGMTGQVKEDILCRFGELGVFVNKGCLYFDPCLLQRNEFLEEGKTFTYVDIHQQQQQISLEKGALSFTYCQVPIVYKLSSETKLEVVHQDNVIKTSDSLRLDLATSRQLFNRTGEIIQITAWVNEAKLR